MAPKNDGLENLPPKLAEYIRKVAKRIRFNRRVRREVTAELADHFSQAMRECDSDDDRQKRADELIAQFGDASVLGSLIRRGKKRCRPRWQKMLIRTAQAFGLFIVFMFVYSLWFISGEPTIRIDYLELFNLRARPSVSESENAWPHYKKAVELYTTFEPYHSEYKNEYRKLKWYLFPWEEVPSDIDPAEHQQHVSNWIEANKSAWAQGELAAHKSHCWLEYKIRHDYPALVNLVIPHLGAKKLAFLGVWLAWEEFQAGNMDAGLDKIAYVHQIGRHWFRPNSILIEQLVGLAALMHADKGLTRSLGRFEFTSDQLARAQSRLESLFPDGLPTVGMEFERMFVLDTIQRTFTDSGFGGGHMVPGEFVTLREKVGMAPILFPILFVHARRDESLSLTKEIFDLSNELARLTPYQRKEKGLMDSIENQLDELPKYRYFLLKMMIPSLGKFTEQAFKGKVSHEATITILALKRWHLEKGEYPVTLDELVAGGFLKEIPDDPFSAGPLVYRRVGDDFTLYSLSENFVDDGGESTEHNYWRDEGDQLFWPHP